MSKKEAIIDYGKFTLTAEHIDYIPSLGNRECGFQVFVYRDEDGDFRRPLWQPSIEIYDADEMRLLYQGWPDPDGVFRARENSQPSEIFFTGDTPRMVWYDHEGEIAIVHHIKQEHLSRLFRDATWGYAEEYGLNATQHPTTYEKNTPSPLQAVLEI